MYRTTHCRCLLLHHLKLSDRLLGNNNPPALGNPPHPASNRQPFTSHALCLTDPTIYPVINGASAISTTIKQNTLTSNVNVYTLIIFFKKI